MSAGTSRLRYVPTGQVDGDEVLPAEHRAGRDLAEPAEELEGAAEARRDGERDAEHEEGDDDQTAATSQPPQRRRHASAAIAAADERSRRRRASRNDQSR